MTKVFISHSFEDQSFARWVRNALVEAGIDAYFDAFDLSPGANFASALRNEVESADALVAILSEKALSHNNVLLEIGMAQGLGKPVIAVLAPGEKPDFSMLASLADTYVLDAAKLNTPELGEKIIKALPKKPVDGEHAGS